MKKERVGFKQKVKKCFVKIKESFKAFFNKEYLSYSYHKYKAFTALQLKEVFGKEKATKNPAREKVIAIAMPIVKFVIVFAFTFLIMFLAVDLFGLILPITLYQFYIFFTAVIIVMQLIASTASCTKNYYIAEDNKVLITFPSAGGSLFLSKVTVEFVKEIKSTLGFYLPVSLGLITYSAFLNRLAPMSFLSIIWAVFPITLLCGMIVLVCSLLSVLYLQYLRLVKTFPFIRAIVLAILFAGVIYLSVLLINLIPENIVLRIVFNDLKASINGFLIKFAEYAVPVSFFCSIVCGVPGVYKGYKLAGISFARFALLFAILIVLFFIVFFAIKKLFLHMMTKSVDYEKVSENSHHLNKVHHQHTTFAFKEFKISFRTLEISGTYIVTYVLIPLLIFLLCKIFDAINTNMKGNMLSIMFIILLIALPLLASNTPLSSAYSREGHAGYIKKTKPIRPYTPMFSKLLFNLFLSIPSIGVSMFIVGRFGKIDIPSLILVGFAVLFLQYAHIFYSSTLDFTKPRNEYYQTEGQGAKNPNENTATIVAFILAAAFAGVVFFFFNEQVKLKADMFVKAAVRVFFIALAVLGGSLTLYLLKLKAFFMER